MAKIEANLVRRSERGRYETKPAEKTTKRRFETIVKRSEDDSNEFNPDSEGFIAIDNYLIRQEVFELYALFTMGRAVADYMRATIVENQDFGS